MNATVQKAQKDFLETIKKMKEGVSKLDPKEQKKSQLLIKELMTCYQNKDIEGLKTLIEKCRQI